MKSIEGRRPYRQQVRAEKTAATRLVMLEAGKRLAAEMPLSAMTLAAVATESGVSVQTVLRHFGTREDYLAAVVEHFRAEVGEQRRVATGEIDEAVRLVVEHYERFGDVILMVLTQETVDRQAADIASAGRRYHDDWVQESFGPSDERAHRLLVVATDLYTWKLLRRDRGLSVERTREHMRLLCRAIIEKIGQEDG